MLVWVVMVGFLMMFVGRGAGGPLTLVVMQLDWGVFETHGEGSFQVFRHKKSAQRRLLSFRER